jgi:hypothetical protein
VVIFHSRTDHNLSINQSVRYPSRIAYNVLVCREENSTDTNLNVGTCDCVWTLYIVSFWLRQLSAVSCHLQRTYATYCPRLLRSVSRHTLGCTCRKSRTVQQSVYCWIPWLGRQPALEDEVQHRHTKTGHVSRNAVTINNKQFSDTMARAVIGAVKPHSTKFNVSLLGGWGHSFATYFSPPSSRFPTCKIQWRGLLRSNALKDERPSRRVWQHLHHLLDDWPQNIAAPKSHYPLGLHGL